MPDSLAIVNRAIAEHQAIRRYVEGVSHSQSDMEALSHLQRTQASMAQSSIQELPQRQKELEQAIGSLNEGLRGHFGFEERDLVPLLGEILGKALGLQHREIGKEMERARAAIAAVKLEGLSQEEAFSKRSQMQQVMSRLRSMVEEHAANEDLILRMMKRALEAGA